MQTLPYAGIKFGAQSKSSADFLRQSYVPIGLESWMIMAMLCCTLHGTSILPLSPVQENVGLNWDCLMMYGIQVLKK